MKRRSFLELAAGGLAAAAAPICPGYARPTVSGTPLVSVTGIPDNPFWSLANPNLHAGFDTLVWLLEMSGLSFYRSPVSRPLTGPRGLIASDDIVLIKVNGQWKYRGATNTDLVRGIVQRILGHPDGFVGEVVLIENGQGRGSLACDVTGSGYPDGGVHANARDERHSFQYLIDTVFRDPRVSGLLLDPYRKTFIGASDHVTTGFRRYENVSYPCFTTPGGRRVELREGIWTGSGYAANLKLINVPVLKTHGGSEFTGALKHFYGLVSMEDGQSPYRHYAGLGETCGKMVASVRPPVLNVLDAIWVSHKELAGYPASATSNARRIAASQDPLALDYWAAKNILYPIDRNAAHNPDNEVVAEWMDAAAAVINGRGGLYDPDRAIYVDQVTSRESDLRILELQVPNEPIPEPSRRYWMD
jgi:hypothetical protein